MTSPVLLPPGHHTCPRRGCGEVIPNRLFACRSCWQALPPALQATLKRTTGRMNGARIRAIQAARRAWEGAR